MSSDLGNSTNDLTLNMTILLTLFIETRITIDLLLVLIILSLLPLLTMVLNKRYIHNLELKTLMGCLSYRLTFKALFKDLYNYRILPRAN